MKYLKLFILIYTCIQFSDCNSKNDTTQKTEEVSATQSDQKLSDVKTNDGPLRKEVFLKAIASLKGDELLDTITLNNALPQSMIGLNRMGLTSRTVKQRNSMIATIEARYKAMDKMLYITITDAGKDSGYLLKLAPWSAMQFQNIRDDGYEKSVIVDGTKIDEKYNSDSHSANLSVIYNSRILVELLGTNFSIEELYTIIK